MTEIERRLPFRLPAGRLGAGDRGATMNDTDRPTADSAVPGARRMSRRRRPVDRHSGVSRRRHHRHAWSRHCRRCTRPAGWRSSWSTTAAPTIPARCAGAGAARHGAAHLHRARAQLRRAQRGHDRAAPRARRLRDHHGRRSAEPARGGRSGCTTMRGWATGTSSTPATASSSMPAGATSAAASPTRWPIVCWTSRRGFTCPRSAACRRSWCGR